MPISSGFLLKLLCLGAALQAAYLFVETPSIVRSAIKSIAPAPHPSGAFVVKSQRVLLQAPATTQFEARTIEAQVWSPDVEAPLRFPVIVYLPSWGGRRDDNSILAAGLSSHGYVVAALDDVMFDGADTRDSADRDVDRTAGFDFSSGTAYERTLRLMDRRVVREARKAARAVDALAQIGASDADQDIATQLDLDKIGILGLSFGGSAAAEAPALDSRFSASANMDGWHFASSARDGVFGPYLMLNSIYPWPSAVELNSPSAAVRYETQLTSRDLKLQEEQTTRRDSYSFFIDGVLHPDFSDELFYSPRRALFSTLDEKLRIHTIVETYLVAFFDRYLKNKPSDLLASSAPPYSQVKSFKSMLCERVGTAKAPTNPG